MSDNFWKDEGSYSEWDMVEEGYDNSGGIPSVVEYNSINPQVIENIQEESAFELDEHDTSVIYNVRLRLEQARLYEMLINHNLFDGVNADPQAIKNVQEELKEYIVERLEILMGIRQDPKTIIKDTANIEVPFNDVEADFLKQLAYKGTKGASIQSSTNDMPLKTLSNKKPKNQLKSLGTIPKITQTTQNTQNKQESVIVNKTKQRASPKKTIQKTVKGGVTPRSLTPQEIEMLAKEDIKNMSKRKPWNKMSEQEKIQEIARVNNKNSVRKRLGDIPMPDENQLRMKYLTDQANRGGANSTGDPLKDQFASMLNNILHNANK